MVQAYNDAQEGNLYTPNVNFRFTTLEATDLERRWSVHLQLFGYNLRVA